MPHEHPKLIRCALHKRTRNPGAFTKSKSLSGYLRPRMNTSYQIAFLVFAALVAATPFDCLPVVTVTVTLWRSVPARSGLPVATNAGSAGKAASQNTPSGLVSLAGNTIPSFNTNKPPVPSFYAVTPEAQRSLRTITLTFRNTTTVPALSVVPFTGTSAGSIAATTVSVTLRSTISLSPSAPSITTAPAGDRTSDYMTISMTNAYGKSLSLSFGSNSGAPSPLGNPSATILPNRAFTQYTFPSGWAGRIYVGPNLNPFGSKIEGSYTGPPDIDVSYVDGYSVPITCSSEGVPVSGCNIDLFQQVGVSCTNKVDGPVCLNPAQGIADGPAPPFFAACRGAAYTYPNDNDANVSNLKSSQVSCCIGTSCRAPSRQPIKRSVDQRKRTISSSLLLPFKRKLRPRELLLLPNQI